MGRSDWLASLALGDEVGVWQGSIGCHLGKVTKITPGRRFTVTGPTFTTKTFNSEGDMYPRPPMAWDVDWRLAEPDDHFRKRHQWFTGEKERVRLLTAMVGYVDWAAPYEFDHELLNPALLMVLDNLRRVESPERDADRAARDLFEAACPNVPVLRPGVYHLANDKTLHLNASGWWLAHGDGNREKAPWESAVAFAHQFSEVV